MIKWEVAKYFFYSKKDVDSIMYIEKNLLKITMSLRKEYVDFLHKLLCRC